MQERGRRCDRPAMYQRWRDLLFLHFSVEPDAIRAIVPQQLEIDTYPDEAGNESAWIGLVPFRMEGVRPRFLPALPGYGAFPETNVRTYVHLDGRPAVWFFSLDAGSSIACRMGRDVFHLPYKDAAMTVARAANEIHYSSSRKHGEAKLEIVARASGVPSGAGPGTLEFFLLERYLLFCTSGQAWFGGNVHHSPYRPREVEILSCFESLVSAAGLEHHPFTHKMFVEGVDVRISPLGSLALSNTVA